MRLSRLGWDSDLFGFEVHRLEATGAPDIDEGALPRGLVEALVDKDQRAEWNGPLEQADFVHVDTRVELALAIDQAKLPVLHLGNCDFSRLGDSHIPHLREVVAGLYLDSRYHHTPGFPCDAIDRLYQAWIESAIRGTHDHEVVALLGGGRLEGFCSLRHAGGGSSIGLFGVVPELRGRGIGPKLLAATICHCSQPPIGSTRMTVVTQGGNAGALKMYRGAAFIEERSREWFHRLR